MQVRIVILAVVLLLLASRAVHTAELGGALLAGLVAGAALGYLGLRHTKFETTPEGSFYTPHTYIGVAVSALLIARIVYRFVTNYPAGLAAAPANGDPFASYHSPLTYAIFAGVVGFYFFYSPRVLMESRDARVPAADSSSP